MYIQIILFILITKLAFKRCNNTSTACYGSRGLDCTLHSLSCPSSLVIQIINTSYGYRPGCNANGQPNCVNAECCEEVCGDCFIQFSSDDDSLLTGNCSGKPTCKIQGFRRFNQIDTVCNGREVNAYSKIQYDCVSEGMLAASTTSTSQSSTSVISCVTQAGDANDVTGDAKDDTGSIVGGVFGAIIILVIIIVVVVFLYKRKTQINKEKTSATVTPEYRVIDGPGTINNRKDISGYDEVDLDSAPKEQATSVQLNPNTINNRNETSGYDEIELDSKPRKQTTDNYDHVGDDQLIVKSPKELDNYNHIGTHGHSIDEDNYNHIGNNLSPSSHHLESDYNHINGVRGTFNDEDDYNHIGDNDNKNVITDDNYHHIGSGDIKVEGDEDHEDRDRHNNEGHDNDDDNRGQDDSEAPYNLASC